jgi:hypothetical protein
MAKTWAVLRTSLHEGYNVGGSTIGLFQQGAFLLSTGRFFINVLSVSVY